MKTLQHACQNTAKFCARLKICSFASLFTVMQAVALCDGLCRLANVQNVRGLFFPKINYRRHTTWGPATITATAHKIVRIIYSMLRDKAEYCDLGVVYYEQKYKSRIMLNLKNRPESFGYRLDPLFSQ